MTKSNKTEKLITLENYKDVNLSDLKDEKGNIIAKIGFFDKKTDNDKNRNNNNKNKKVKLYFYFEPYNDRNTVNFRQEQQIYGKTEREIYKEAYDRYLELKTS